MKLIVLTTHMNVSSPAFQGRSVVSIANFANGACGEHRRHDSDGIRLEIDAPGCRSRVRKSTELNVWQPGHE
jgi:hypothetical protein